MQTITNPQTAYTAGPWVVPSATTAGLAYVVRVDGRTALYTCTCPDHTNRSRDCKHIRSVQSIRRTVDTPTSTVGSVDDLYGDGGASLTRALKSRTAVPQ